MVLIGASKCKSRPENHHLHRGKNRLPHPVRRRNRHFADHSTKNHLIGRLAKRKTPVSTVFCGSFCPKISTLGI